MNTNKCWILLILLFSSVSLSFNVSAQDYLRTSFGCKLDEYTFVNKSFYCYTFHIEGKKQYPLTGACLSENRIPIKKRYVSLKQFFYQFYNDNSYYSTIYFPFYRNLCFSFLENWPEAYSDCVWNSITFVNENYSDSIPVKRSISAESILAYDYDIDINEQIAQVETEKKVKIFNKHNGNICNGYVDIFLMKGVFIETTVDKLGTIDHGPHFEDERTSSIYKKQDLIKRNRKCYIPFQVDIEKAPFEP